MNITLVLYIGVISLIIVGITVLLAMLYKNKPFIKYVPAIITFLGVSIYCAFLAASGGRGEFLNLVYVILALMTAPAAFLSLATAVIFDIIRASSRRSRKEGK